MKPGGNGGRRVDEPGAVPPAPWSLEIGSEPLVAVALHGGHALRPEVARLLRLDEAHRLREEDPGTDAWTAPFATRVVVHRSRFEVDLNRPPETAVYVRPEQAWGMHLWGEPPPPPLVERSLALHHAFYSAVHRLLRELERAHGRFLVFDLHSYNHRRAGPDAPPAAAAGNPDINVGTGSMDRARWGDVVDGFLAALQRRGRRLGLELDVRENANFRGGWFPTWVHATFPRGGCALAVEVKKTYIDEWSGRLDVDRSRAISELLRGAALDVGAAAGLPAQPGASP